ncbi:hypothetical protein M011DRAFT_487505 [Sporormia fimetaria CBS 119925]|uniref:MARVEL domain-containing protein n=1 Tax=Sporormia fimetaria CBS 119925 TaxID=1340428 RepID=A0A6A6V7W6_9PLEO|nr:hypothetical protein M011DRAFT_487505 [Sporormia fimetaria CBS 119925]
MTVTLDAIDHRTGFLPSPQSHHLASALFRVEMNAQQNRALGQGLRRIVAIIQLLLALAVLISFVFFVWSDYSYDYYYTGDYDFIAAFFCSLITTGIIIAVYVQRKVALSLRTTLYLDIIRSGLATALWIWLMIDCSVVDRCRYYTCDRPKKELYKRKRLVRAWLAVIVLLIFFYVPMVYTWYEKTVLGENESEDVTEEQSRGHGASESTPLLHGHDTV